ncbi:hypothetical protein A5788_15145 [Gordonia sp. 852002-50816_SCH5313054-c]|uniref:hypothetical protein n=1 Tax=Gordonia TaxID=2053 RepID=UPI0007EB79F1|nr:MULTISPECIES: hypothetical protein [unclassified Gordonia (in: high G+C Gram-positive bacteria)]OBC07899.1 hypothetical protein A5786_08515 [Gordonia sp. 852002-50816_SCH5313054-a]OBC15682.1 hypothetical protein A5788_15145 [Gordonia sp. 852002-50816_SCH5313054-c]
MSIRRTHTDNPQHPAAIVGFAIFLIGFGAAPLALTALAFGSGTAALVAAIVAVIGMAIGIGIVSAMTRRLQHSALLPDATSKEEQHYLEVYRHQVA